MTESAPASSARVKAAAWFDYNIPKYKFSVIILCYYVGVSQTHNNNNSQ